MSIERATESGPEELPETVVRHVARLARLSLSNDEVRAMQRQLGAVLEHMSILRELDPRDTTPMAHPIDTTNAWGSDIVESGLERAVVDRLAPESADGFFVVPKVFDDGSAA